MQCVAARVCLHPFLAVVLPAKARISLFHLKSSSRDIALLNPKHLPRGQRHPRSRSRSRSGSHRRCCSRSHRRRCCFLGPLVHRLQLLPAPLRPRPPGFGRASRASPGCSVLAELHPAVLPHPPTRETSASRRRHRLLALSARPHYLPPRRHSPE